MVRNRELWIFTAALLGLGVLGTLAAWLWAGGRAAAVCGATALLLCGASLGFTLWRYRQLKRLAASISRAAAEGTVLEDGHSNREGELSILQNELYRLTSALAGQNDRLRRDKRFLANTLSDISHQLKTPLTSVMVLCDLLEEEDLPPEKRREFLQRVSTQLERLRWLVNALLKLSRLDAAVVPFKKQELQLHGLLSRCTAPLLPLAEQRGVALLVDCPAQLCWQGDGEWTGEALGNLVKNCVEHARANVWVTCRENPLQTLITVEDDGPGFNQEDLPRLFERFYRGSGAVGGEGVGIGLALARGILVNQNADLVAENRPGGGARFVVKLLRRREDGPPAGTQDV